MRRAKTWWRDLGGLLAACVLALLVVAPVANAGPCVCADSFAVSDLGGAAAQNDKHGDKGACEAACCLGGHCHQGASVLNPLVPGLPTPLAIGTEPSSAMTPPALASRAIAGPDRPPRA